MMKDLTYRLKKILNWLIFQEIVENGQDLAKKIGYNGNVLSQIFNCKIPLSDRFLKKLCSLDKNINEDWVRTGNGSMFNNIGDYIYQRGGVRNIGKIVGTYGNVEQQKEDIKIIKEEIKYLEDILQEQERLIKVLMDKNKN